MEVVLIHEDGQAGHIARTYQGTQNAYRGGACARCRGKWGLVGQIEKSVPASQGISVLAGDTKHSPT